MALPTFAMGSYGLLFRPKDVLFEIIDSAISVSASRWPEDLEGQRHQILTRLGLASPDSDQKEKETKKKKKKEEVPTPPDLSAKEKKAPAARKGKEISAEIVVRNCNQYDDVGRGRVHVEVELRNPPAKESAVGEARGKPRESSLEEKREIDGDKALGFAREDRGRAATPPRRKVESYSARGRGESRGRRSEDAADHHYQRRRRSEDWYHGDYHRTRRRNFDRDQRRYGGCKRSYNTDERRYNGLRCEEEERSRKRQRIVEEASVTTTAGGNGSRRVIQ